MKKLNEVVDKFFSDTEPLTLKTLFEEVEKVIDLFDLKSLNEADGEEAQYTGPRTYSIKEIPLIPISEMGWANAQTCKEGEDCEDVPPEQRNQLVQYLQNIGGKTLEEKLAKIQDFMESPPGPGGDRKEYIRKVLTYLVFYKTLTLAITNFNAAAAGFNFEAFLAALLKGRQIPASGADTIADIAVDYGDGEVPLSLKLYKEGNLKVGGSFNDLCNDMINDAGLTGAAEWPWANKPEYDFGGMRYLACTKALKGAGLDQTGAINFYQFDITRKNLFNIMSQAVKGRNCIKLAGPFVEAYNRGERGEDLEAFLSTVPEKGQMPEIDDIAATYASYIDIKLEELKPGLADELVGSLKEKLASDYEQHMRNAVDAAEDGNFKSGMTRIDFGKRYLAGIFITIAYPDEGINLNSSVQLRKYPLIAEFDTKVREAYIKFRDDFLNKLDVRKEFLSKVKFLDAKASTDLYNGMDADIKKLAIRNTIGYLRRLEWEVSKGVAVTEAVKQGFGTDEDSALAVLKIGSKNVGNLLNNIRNTLMNEVFEIFEAVQKMSDYLNAYFAGGLDDPKLATAAIEESNKIAIKTAKVEPEAGTTPGPPPRGQAMAGAQVDVGGFGGQYSVAEE